MKGDKHYYVESFDTVAVTSFRLGQSPFAHRYVTDETVFGVYCDRLFPLKLTDNEDPVPLYWKLRRGVLLYDVPEKPLEIVGPDAARLLEGVLACKVDTLPVGRCRYGIACREDGTVLMDGVVMRLSEDRFWYVKANGEFESWLGANALGLDVKVSDPQSRVLQIQGPKSLDVLDAATGGGLSADFRYFHAGFFEVCGQTLWVSRTGWTGEVGIEIYCNSGPRPTDHDALWDGLLACGEPFGMEFSSGWSMGVRRVESGILDNGTDIEPDLTPYGAGLGHFVRLEKQDFIGRAALERADRSRLLFGLVCPTTTPQAGMTVHFNDGPVGHLTVGTWSPTLDAGVGYVRFDQPLPGDDWYAKTVFLHDQDGVSHEATVDTLPFFDKEKRLPRAPWTGAPYS
ncbi:MAG: aminomethyl transferase family protein [Acidimicrobiia bacterium]|nr:aminomethyl transferase family protein [Acidimicrobiia bacterium]MYG93230.1 aminomethyl transferase family protein [Acidimicrobiia bacterium]MYH05896.1 aminomethyl transferase family protein [Acidimicrobiia bacterium]MYK56818.1 aminomethyl transferase family protein [Acidimicrobiia bacterium]